MAEVLSPQLQQPSGLRPVQLPHHDKPRLPPTTIAIPQSASTIRNGNLNLGVFSPVNQNGSFEFDRVLRSGEVCKRTRKTKVCSHNRLWTALLRNQYSNGRNFISSSARTCSRSTRMLLRRSSSNRLTFQILLLWLIRKTREVEERTSSGYSHLRGIITYKPTTRRMHVNGWSLSKRKQESTRKKRSLPLAVR